MTPTGARILLVDDEPNIVSFLRKSLSDEGYGVFSAASGKEACDIAEREQVHLALVDLIMPDISGIEVLKTLKECSPHTKVIIMTAFATAETAVEAMKEGALDYLIKPFSLDEVKLQVKRTIGEVSLTREVHVLRREIARRSTGEDVIGKSRAIAEVCALTDKLAGTDTTVLISGETGTGKELIARRLHEGSPRKEGPFLAINCSAIPETMLERELFGHERGAFTDANATRPGLLEAASDGTLLLDEIGDMPASLQAKLLRILEGHEFLRIGGTRPIKSRVRFAASTNRDLADEVAKGRFREDLFYRLNVIVVKLPPLRERREDIVPLAAHFLAKMSRQRGTALPRISREAEKLLLGYSWPGNVRELQNVIERAVVLAKGDTIRGRDLSLGLLGRRDDDNRRGISTLPFRKARDEFEKTYIAQALKSCRGNVSKTAKKIRLDRKNLEDKISKFRLKRLMD